LGVLRNSNRGECPTVLNLEKLRLVEHRIWTKFGILIFEIDIYMKLGQNKKEQKLIQFIQQ